MYWKYVGWPCVSVLKNKMLQVCTCIIYCRAHTYKLNKLIQIFILVKALEAYSNKNLPCNDNKDKAMFSNQKKNDYNRNRNNNYYNYKNNIHIDI